MPILESHVAAIKVDEKVIRLDKIFTVGAIEATA